MPRRVSLLFISAAIALVACAQPRPQRSALPDLPDDMEFPAVTTTTADPVPDDGTCYLVEAVGATITTVQDGYDSANVLVDGDVLTAFDGSVIVGPDSLIAAVQGHVPGDTVRIEFSRNGVGMSADVVLGSAPDDETVPRIGIGLDTEVVPLTPDEVIADSPPPDAHYVIVEEALMRVEVGDGTWFTTGLAAPLSSIVDIDGDLYVSDPNRLPLLASLGAGQPVPVPTGGRPLVRALSTIGDLVEVALQDGPGYSIVGFDSATQSVEWEWPVVDALGTSAEPLVGYTSPGGDTTVVVMEQESARVFTLIDESGEAIAGFGTDTDLIPTGAAFAGWYDATHVAFVSAGTADVSVVTIDVGSGESQVAANLTSDESLRQVWASGDGRHVTTVTGADTILHDLVSETAHLLARNCDLGFIGSADL